MKSCSIKEIKRRLLASKTFLIMRISLLFLICCVMQVAASASYSQSTSLTLKVKEASIEKVLDLIEEQSEFRFLYNKKIVDVDRKVDVYAKEENVSNILDNIFKNENIDYVINDRYIILRSANSENGVKQNMTVRGIVKDRNGEPIIGANILIRGTSTGVITDLNGQFSLEVPNDKAVLAVSYIGFKQQFVPINGKSNLNIVLASAIEELDEVVVTAMGIKREKKALGYAMQEIKTENFTANRSESVSNMLQGKIAGVQISQSGTGLGGSTRIVMRGLSSLSGNNQPLWVIDGVPINDNVAGAADQWGGVDYSGGASEINPENIESISVLKGPNAAAMYGSRAQNGAIVIVTKKGKKNQPLQIEYNGSVNFSTIYDGYKLQNVYGQGSDGEFNPNSFSSWGPKMEGQTVDNWRFTRYGDDRYGTTYSLLPQKSQMKDFYQTGVNYNNTLSLTAGGEFLSGRMSYTDSRNEGVTPSHKLIRQHLDANINFTNNKWLQVGMNVSYTRQKGVNRPEQGEYGIMNQFIRMPRSIRTADLVDPESWDGKPLNWSGPSNELFNPYAYFHGGNGNRDRQNRLIGQINATVTFTDYLKLTGKVGLDWTNVDIRTVRPFAFRTNSSQYDIIPRTFQEFNSDLMLNFNKTFGDYSIQANLGTAVYNAKSQNMTIHAGIFQIPRLVSLANGDARTITEGKSVKEIQSVFGNVQFGFKNAIYLDFTARNDWSSTLPKQNWSYFYPSVNLSAVLSEILPLPEQFSFVKLRGSWAKVGNDTAAYQLESLFATGQILELVLGANKSSIYPLSNMRPESTQSYEGGLDLRMFGGRFGVDFTYYNSKTTDQILSISMIESSGYSTKKINAGKISSHGIELMLNGTIIDTKDWTWGVNLNWGTNTTKCVKLDPNVKRFTLGSIRIGSVVVEEGGKFGDIVANKAYKRNEAGDIITKDGIPVLDRDKVIGNMLPDWTGSVSTNLRWKDLSMNVLIDIRHGGDIVSVTDSYASQIGNSLRSLEGRDGMVVKGIDMDTGQPNTTKITAQKFYQSVGGPEGVAEEFMYDASYVKLREIALGYNLPKQWIEKTPLKSVRISAYGRDLFFIHKNTPGFNPEGSFSRNDYAQAFEVSSIPPTRSFGLNLNVKF